MIAIEKIGCYSQFPRGRGTPHHIGVRTWGSIRIGQEAEGARGKYEKGALLWFCGEEWWK